jgi:hypothetical protein
MNRHIAGLIDPLNSELFELKMNDRMIAGGNRHPGSALRIRGVADDWHIGSMVNSLSSSSSDWKKLES